APSYWDAQWIWAGAVEARGPLAAGGAPPKQYWDRTCLLRRSFVIAEVPEKAVARVAADSRFVLYLNGEEVARGPARAVPERLAWTELDLAPLLRPGGNVVAALVHFYGRLMPWWRP